MFFIAEKAGKRRKVLPDFSLRQEKLLRILSFGCDEIPPLAIHKKASGKISGCFFQTFIRGTADAPEPKAFG